MSARILHNGSAFGVGKATPVTGLLSALQGHGLDVRTFKARPNYLYSTYHALAAGVPGHNLDTWLVLPANLRERCTAVTASADLAIIEVMVGLYDFSDYLAESGSIAELVKLLKTPVTLVRDDGLADHPHFWTNLVLADRFVTAYHAQREETIA